MALEPSVINSLGMEFVLVPAGTFVMGAEKKEAVNVGADEGPTHTVTISKPYYLGKFEVTQEQWEAIMGENPSSHKGKNLPVDTISWDNIYLFIRKLNQKEGQLPVSTNLRIWVAFAAIFVGYTTTKPIP